MVNENMVEVTCEVCGKKVMRPKEFKLYQKQHPDIHWDLKLSLCDEHFTEKVGKAIRNISSIINILSDEF